MPKVSVITPCFNAENYVGETISSVLSQKHKDIELLLIDDGSTDSTATVIQEFKDPRIRYIRKENGGVSSARNKGLEVMDGDFFCFLDADDVFPPNSISSRLEVFEEHDDVNFVDGGVSYVDAHLNGLNRTYCPRFNGDPLDSLLKLDAKCLFGNTWMIKRDKDVIYSFEEDLTHAEDLFFYLNVCFQKKGTYGFTKDTILLYRQSQGSAMKNLKGLEDGYGKLLRKIKGKPRVRKHQLLFLKFKITKIMILSHLFDGKDILSAIRVIPKYVFI